ncbi:MAG TPA: hypothetical protein VLE89_08780 [Chlamydiales bacterium]|nr:hypothetical protein [Chlamydiales bacterium]
MKTITSMGCSPLTGWTSKSAGESNLTFSPSRRNIILKFGEQIHRFFSLFCILCLVSCGQTGDVTENGSRVEGVKKCRVGFFVRHLNVRGTEVATFDYADCNETILGNESFIFYINIEEVPLDAIDHPSTVYKKFQDRFGERFYECANFEEVDFIISKEHVDILYNLKAGRRDEYLSRVCKNAVHAVFLPLEVHGDAYATVSGWMSKIASSDFGIHVPFVPHMVRLEETSETLHEELNIPKGAVVFGRHGGYTTFSLEFAQEVVIEIAEVHPDWYFIFLNTEPFCQLKNVIFLPGTADLGYKTKFINTCDAMIHAREDGETFGLSCAEFSIKNKPVITCTVAGYQAHVAILGDKGLYYQNKAELKSIVESCGSNIDEIRSSNWDAYSAVYNPEAVMKQFDTVFLKGLAEKRRDKR